MNCSLKSLIVDDFFPEHYRSEYLQVLRKREEEAGIDVTLKDSQVIPDILETMAITS